MPLSLVKLFHSMWKIILSFLSVNSTHFDVHYLKFFHCTFLYIPWDIFEFYVDWAAIYTLVACKMQTSSPASSWEEDSVLK